MDFLRSIGESIASILTATALVSLLAFLFRESIKNYFEHLVNVREEKLRHDLAVSADIKKTFRPMLQEITELVYRLRNLTRDIVSKEIVVGELPLDHLEVCSLLTERLFKYRAFLDKGLWTQLHSFKRTNQDFDLLLDVASRPENIKKYHGRFSEELLVKARDLYSFINELHDELIPSLQKKMRGEG